MADKLIDKDEVYEIVGACFEVYNTLGHGYLEVVYQEAWTRRKRRGCRPNRTPAAERRDRRQSTGPLQPFPSPQRARQARSIASPVCGLPLVQPPRRFRYATRTASQPPRGRAPSRPAFRAGSSGGAGESHGEFFGPDVAGDAPVHLAGPMRKRKPVAPFTSRSHVGGCPKKLGASCSLRRSGGQRATSALLPEHQAQTLNYLRATGLKVAVLVNFGKPQGIQWKRLVF